MFSFCEAPIVTILVDEENDDDGERGPNQQGIPGSNERLLCNSPFNSKKGGCLKRFLVHENLLCDASPVLRAAFQGNFAEAGTKSMTIKNLDVGMVNVFLGWLYSDKRFPEKPDTIDAEQVWFLNMARLAVVADVYQIEGLGDSVIDHLVRVSWLNPPQWPIVEFIYENTSGQSILRRWIVAIYVERTNYNWFCLDTTNLAVLPEFANDVAKAFGRQKSSSAFGSFFDMNREERKAPLPIRKAPLPFRPSIFG